MKKTLWLMVVVVFIAVNKYLPYDSYLITRILVYIGGIGLIFDTTYCYVKDKPMALGLASVPVEDKFFRIVTLVLYWGFGLLFLISELLR